MAEWTPELVKLEIYTPCAALEGLLEALAQAGAGVVGRYTHVCSYAQVEGTWTPLPGASPSDGKAGEMSRGTEYKLEVRCSAQAVPEALAAVRANHPYEQPVVNILPLYNGMWGEEL